MTQLIDVGHILPDGIEDADESLLRWFAVCLFKQAICSQHVIFKNKKASESKALLRDAFAYCYGVDDQAPACMRLAWPALIDTPRKAAEGCWNSYVRGNSEAVAIAEATWGYLQEVWSICGDRSPQLLVDGTCFIDPPHSFCGPDL